MYRASGAIMYRFAGIARPLVTLGRRIRALRVAIGWIGASTIHVPLLPGIDVGNSGFVDV